MGLFVLRNAGDSVMLYLPQGFSLLCRYYRPDGKRSLLPPATTPKEQKATK